MMPSMLDCEKQAAGSMLTRPLPEDWRDIGFEAQCKYCKQHANIVWMDESGLYIALSIEMEAKVLMEWVDGGFECTRYVYKTTELPRTTA